MTIVNHQFNYNTNTKQYGNEEIKIVFKFYRKVIEEIRIDEAVHLEFFNKKKINLNEIQISFYLGWPTKIPSQSLKTNAKCYTLNTVMCSWH